MDEPDYDAKKNAMRAAAEEEAKQEPLRQMPQYKPAYEAALAKLRETDGKDASIPFGRSESNARQIDETERSLGWPHVDIQPGSRSPKEPRNPVGDMREGTHSLAERLAYNDARITWNKEQALARARQEKYAENKK